MPSACSPGKGLVPADRPVPPHASLPAPPSRQLARSGLVLRDAGRGSGGTCPVQALPLRFAPLLPGGSPSPFGRLPPQTCGVLCLRLTPRPACASGVSPDKNANCSFTAPAFASGPEPWASVCCATSPGPSALYAVPVRGLTALTPASFPRSVAVAIPLRFIAAGEGSPSPFGRLRS